MSAGYIGKLASYAILACLRIINKKKAVAAFGLRNYLPFLAFLPFWHNEVSDGEGEAWKYYRA